MVAQGKSGIHIGENGPAPCNADVNPCPLKRQGIKHFTGPNAESEAEEYYAAIMSDESYAAKTHRKPDKMNINNKMNTLQEDLNKARSVSRVLNDEEFNRRPPFAKDILNFKKDFKSLNIYAKKSENGFIFDMFRKLEHEEIISDFIESNKNVPCEGIAIIAGGPGGAGKSTVIRDFANIQEDQFATINADDIKETMAQKNMIPNIPGLTPMEASPLVHEEASLLSKNYWEFQRLDNKM